MGKAKRKCVFCVLLNSQQSTINHQNVPRFCNRHVNRLLLDAVPLACNVERRDPQAPPWEAVCACKCSTAMEIIRPKRLSFFFMSFFFNATFCESAQDRPIFIMADQHLKRVFFRMVPAFPAPGRDCCPGGQAVAQNNQAMPPFVIQEHHARMHRAAAVHPAVFEYVCGRHQGTIVLSSCYQL